MEEPHRKAVKHAVSVRQSSDALHQDDFASSPILNAKGGNMSCHPDSPYLRGTGRRSRTLTPPGNDAVAVIRIPGRGVSVPIPSASIQRTSVSAETVRMRLQGPSLLTAHDRGEHIPARHAVPESGAATDRASAFFQESERRNEGRRGVSGATRLGGSSPLSYQSDQ
jgi:hypothetical protein